jgi:hypothetical protein
MPDPKEQERRSTEFDPKPEESAGRTANKAVSSKRVKDAGRLEKNAGPTPPGKPRSGSDSNTSRRTRGH